MIGGTQHVSATKLFILTPKCFFVINVTNMSLRLHLGNIINLHNSYFSNFTNFTNRQI